MPEPTRLTRQQQAPRYADSLIAKHDPLIRQAFEAAVQERHTVCCFAALVEPYSAMTLIGRQTCCGSIRRCCGPLEEAIRNGDVCRARLSCLPKGIAGAFPFNGRTQGQSSILGAKWVQGWSLDRPSGR